MVGLRGLVQRLGDVDAILRGVLAGAAVGGSRGRGFGARVRRRCFGCDDVALVGSGRRRGGPPWRRPGGRWPAVGCRARVTGLAATAPLTATSPCWAGRPAPRQPRPWAGPRYRAPWSPHRAARQRRWPAQRRAPHAPPRRPCRDRPPRPWADPGYPAPWSPHRAARRRRWHAQRRVPHAPLRRPCRDQPPRPSAVQLSSTLVAASGSAATSVACSAPDAAGAASPAVP